VYYICLDLEKAAMFPRFGCSNSGEKAKKRDKGMTDKGGRVSLEYLLSELSDDDINAQ